jgi:coproporphyrinogen III oxidase
MRRAQIVLISLAAIAFLWFASRTAVILWHYEKLSQHAVAEITAWGVQKKGGSKYILYAAYTFEVDGQKFFSKTFFTQPVFLNAPSAEAEGKQWMSKPLQVWYHPSKPSISSLEKNFPFKASIHALLSLGLLLYFFFLRKYLTRLESFSGAGTLQ